MEFITVKVETGVYDVKVGETIIGRVEKTLDSNKWNASLENGGTLSGDNGTWDANQYKTCKAAAQAIADFIELHGGQICPLCNTRHKGSHYETQRVEVCGECVDRAYHNIGGHINVDVTDGDIRAEIEKMLERKTTAAQEAAERKEKFEAWLQRVYGWNLTDFYMDSVIRDRRSLYVEEVGSVEQVRQNMIAEFEFALEVELLEVSSSNLADYQTGHVTVTVGASPPYAIPVDSTPKCECGNAIPETSTVNLCDDCLLQQLEPETIESSTVSVGIGQPCETCKGTDKNCGTCGGSGLQPIRTKRQRQRDAKKQRRREERAAQQA